MKYICDKCGDETDVNCSKYARRVECLHCYVQGEIAFQMQKPQAS